MNTISEQFYYNSQSWHYEQVVEITTVMGARGKLKVKIERNAYDEQSSIRGYALDPHHLKWNLLVDKPITAGNCQKFSYAQKASTVEKEIFQKDADEVLEELMAIVY